MNRQQWKKYFGRQREQRRLEGDSPIIWLRTDGKHAFTVWTDCTFDESRVAPGTTIVSIEEWQRLQGSACGHDTAGQPGGLQ